MADEAASADPPEHPPPVLQCYKEAPGQALEHETVALTRLAHGGGGHNGQQLLKVLHQHTAGYHTRVTS